MRKYSLFVVSYLTYSAMMTQLMYVVCSYYMVRYFNYIVRINIEDTVRGQNAWKWSDGVGAGGVVGLLGGCVDDVFLLTYA